MSLIEAVILAIIEGLTEFLPVSSTGHMVMASSVMGIEEDTFVKVFTIAVQLGAILAVVVYYSRKFFNFRKWEFYAKLMLAVLPALIFGFLFDDKIEALLESPVVVAISLVLGGIVLLFIDGLFKSPKVHNEEEVTFFSALKIGFWQCVAMIPGVSRSASSIIGGMQQGLSRGIAAEFSFFLAVPTMCAATGYSLFIKKWDAATQVKGYELITASTENMVSFAVGNIAAFVVALIAIRFFISFLNKSGFKIFGYYRIVAGLAYLALFFAGLLK